VVSVTGGWDERVGRNTAGSVRLCGLNRGARPNVLTTDSNHPGYLAVAPSPTQEQFATAGSDRVIGLWDASTGKTIKMLARQDRPLWAIAYSPDGKQLALNQA
jgi:WD40 repeat protein